MAVSITEFQLDEYRGGNPLRVLDLGNGLNVALVRSDSGRSQLLQVVPWTFYGPGNFFPAATRDGDYLIPPGRSGLAKIRSDHGVFYIERQWEDTEDTLPRLTANDGKVYEANYLDNILEGLPAKSYREIFTFDLSRLRRLVRNEPYGLDRLTRLAQYLQRKSPQNTVAESSPIHQLENIDEQIGQLTELIHQAANRDAPDSPSGDREKLNRQLTKLDNDIADSKAKQKHLQSEIEETQCAISAHRINLRLRDISHEVSDSRPAKASREVAALNEEAAARLDDKIAMLKQELKDLQVERDELKRQGRELGNLKKVATLAPQIDAVLMQEKTLIREEASIEQLSQQIHDLEARLESERLGAGTRAELASMNRTESHSGARVDALAERLRESEREIQSCQDRLARAEASGSMVAESLARATAYTSHPEDAVAIHEAQERLTALHELAGLDEQLQRLEAERDELTIRLKRLYAQQLMPFQMMMALGIPFMVGVAMIIYGLIMTPGTTNWTLVTIGFAAALITSLVKITMDRSVSDALFSVRKRLSRINYQIEEIAAAREAAGDNGLSLARQIEDAERQLAALQTQFASHETHIQPTAELTHGASSIESARIQLNDARRRDQELKQAWRELMIELDLSPNLTPIHAREVLAERAAHSGASVPLDESRRLEYQIQQTRNEIERRREWMSTMLGHARQLLKELGFSTSSHDTVGEQMDLLREKMNDHKDRMQTRRTLLRSLARLRHQQNRIKENGRRLTEQRKKLDDDVKHRQEQARIQKQLQSDRLKMLEKQRDTLQRELTEIRERFGAGDQLPLAELTGEELETRLDSQRSRLTKQQERLVKLSEQRGRCRAMLKVSDTGIGDSDDNHWELLLRRSRELADDFQSRLALLNGPTDRYLYLEQAAGYLNELSAGQFVDLDVNHDGQLILTSHDGMVAKLDEVRQEHNANVYFSLWLARLEAYASRGLRLPIVMEDPLEATDPSRRPIVAKLLTEFAARGYQFILVTSNPNNAELFSRLDVPIADLSEREVEVEVQPNEPIDEVVYAESHGEVLQPQPVALDESQEPLFPHFG